MNSGSAQSWSSEVSWTHKRVLRMCQIGSECSCDSGGKITSPLGRQRGEDVQPEVGLKSQDGAEQWVSLPQRREGQCSRSRA